MGQGSSDDDTDDIVTSQARNSLPTPPQSPILVSGSPLRAHCNHGDPFLDSSVRSRRAEKGHNFPEDGSLSSLETLHFEIPTDLIQSSLSNGCPASENHPWRRPSRSAHLHGVHATPKDRSVHEHFKPALHDDGSHDGNATPALTPDISPQRRSCLTTPISSSYGRGNLDGEFEEAEKGKVEGTASPEIFETAPRTPPMPTFISALNKRLRPSQRPLRDHQVAQSPTRTPDRFISRRSVTSNPHQQLKVGKLTSKLSGTERSLRRRTGTSDPFRLQRQSRAISINTVIEGPLESLHASRVRADSGLRLGSAAASSGLHQITPSSVWHVGGPSIAAGRQPVSSANFDIMPISRPNAPVYTSRFISSIKSDKGRSLHEKRLALALGIDPLNKILGHGPDIVNRFGDTTLFGPRFGVRHAAATKAFHDAGYGAMTWEDNAWIKRGSLRRNLRVKSERKAVPMLAFRVLEAPNLRDDFYCSVLAYSVTADRLAVGLADKLYLWSEETGVVNPPREVEPRFSRLTYITSLAFSSAQGGRAILAIGRANGCISMYSPLESDSHFMDVSMVTAAAHLCFSPKPVRRPSARHVAVLTEQEVLLVGDDAGVVHVYLVEWPSISQRDLFGWPGASTLHCKIAVHTQQICGIGWSPDGTYFATGGNDNLCALFDSRKILAPPPGIAIFRTEAARHRWRLAAAVKAIAFCPWQRGLLAAGGGSNDRGIHFYHTMSGAALAVIDCAAQVTSLIWSTTRREIVATFGFAQPEHPYRIVVYAWPSCRQVVAIPWQEEMRALFAIAYPGGPNGARGRHTVQQQRRRQEGENERTQVDIASGSTTTGPSTPRTTLGRGRVSRRAGAVAEGATGARRTREEGCIVVAGSDGSIKFHEVWADDERDAAPPRGRHSVGGGLSVLGRHGLLGGSDILEGLHGIDREDAEVIR